ncbi:hypothetical protein WMY93_015506 [Mugilogobius chulae]|uniref:Uncharacterized protein n=1 Tax=Mugilogobius chulae TaxID=88201 RepID=A0AAW0NUY3_9GOBI
MRTLESQHENLESQQETGSPSQEVALLLHRKGFDCSSCPRARAGVHVERARADKLVGHFGALGLHSLKKSGLTLLRLDDQPDSATTGAARLRHRQEQPDSATDRSSTCTQYTYGDPRFQSAAGMSQSQKSLSTNHRRASGTNHRRVSGTNHRAASGTNHRRASGRM